MLIGQLKGVSRATSDEFDPLYPLGSRAGECDSRGIAKCEERLTRLVYDNTMAGVLAFDHVTTGYFDNPRAHLALQNYQSTSLSRKKKLSVDDFVG
jgi:hypothetical protein